MYRKKIEEMIADTREKLVIDLRAREDYDRETFPGAINIYWEDWYKEEPQLSKEIPIYLLCYTEKRSDDIAGKLSREGYEIYSIESGFSAFAWWSVKEKIENPNDEKPFYKDVERSIIKKFRKSIWVPFVKAINEYELIKDGDRIAVCISGGKDSMLMAKLFQELERHGRKNFDVTFLVMNPGYNDINYQMILNNAKLLNVPINTF
ncbi:MAG: ATPase, partial [Butyrivibrio sp.]|nr:ATPase [Butyrivibrio sp.]